jgi:hypothetical protein
MRNPGAAQTRASDPTLTRTLKEHNVAPENFGRESVKENHFAILLSIVAALSFGRPAMAHDSFAALQQ